jgi:DNA-binding CsgD family transcriptional regulator
VIQSASPGALNKASNAAAVLGSSIDDALSDIGVPAFILASDGVIRWQNATATELVGEVPGRHFSSVVAPETLHDARVEFAKQMVGTARTTDSPLVIRAGDGTRFAVAVRTVSLADGQRVVGVFGVIEVHAEYAVPAQLREPLTPRQHQVLVELARGASTEQIAASLGIAPVTVRNHVRGLLRALRVHSRLEAVAESRRRGLLGP